MAKAGGFMRIIDLFSGAGGLTFGFYYRIKQNRFVRNRKNSFVFANDDGSVRSYSGTRKIFDRFKRRNNLHKSNVHFHGLRHTFSNMLFEMNENPKVIQQLLGHRDVKTTITVYNSVDNEYIRQTTEKFNEKVKEDQLILELKKREEVLE